MNYVINFILSRINTLSILFLCLSVFLFTKLMQSNSELNSTQKSLQAVTTELTTVKSSVDRLKNEYTTSIAQLESANQLLTEQYNDEVSQINARWEDKINASTKCEDAVGTLRREAIKLRKLK